MNTEDCIKCPHCMSTHLNFEDYVDPVEHSADFPMQCEYCKEWFQVAMDTTIHFETEALGEAPEGYE